MSEKKKVFVSFRFSDGSKIKEKLIDFLEKQDLIIDKSEDKDRSEMSEETIQTYLFEKLKDSSITIVLLTPEAVNYKRSYLQEIDDWMYDELRYSLYNREGNPINGVIALFTPQAESSLLQTTTHKCEKCNESTTVYSLLNFDNLVRDNMINVLDKYKKNQCDEIYDSDYDSYISLVKLEEFYNSPSKYLEIATEKRKNSNHFKIRVRKD